MNRLGTGSPGEWIWLWEDRLERIHVVSREEGIMSIEYRDSTARRALATLAIRRGGLASLEEACRETMSERWRIAMLPERLLSALLIRSYLHRWSAWNAASLKRDVLVDWDQAFREKRGWDLVPAENGPIPRNLSEIYDFVLRNSIVEMNEVSVFT